MIRRDDDMIMLFLRFLNEEKNNNMLLEFALSNIKTS